MPKRTPADIELIVKTYQELGEGRATARALNIHENTVYAIMRKHRGKCKQCGKDLTPGKSYCADCAQIHAERQRNRRKESVRKGVCLYCNKPVAAPSRRFCAEHRLVEIEASARYTERQKQKRGNMHPGVPNQRQKERHLLWKYGKAAVEIWRELNGTCVLCGAQHENRAIHIHHIDSDQENNAKENLTCLCFSCHRMVHLLVEHSDPARAIAWIRSTYPTLPV